MTKLETMLHKKGIKKGDLKELIKMQVRKERGSAPIRKNISRVMDTITDIRWNWEPLREKADKSKYAQQLNPIFKALRATGGLPGHTLTWLSRMFLERVQGELWDHGSAKGEAINEVLRHIEDLHSAMRSDDEDACRAQALEIFTGWLEEVEGTRVKKAWRAA